MISWHLSTHVEARLSTCSRRATTRLILFQRDAAIVRIIVFCPPATAPAATATCARVILCAEQYPSD